MSSLIERDFDFLERYSRQLLVPGWSLGTQISLCNLSVAVSSKLPTAVLYLAAAGAEKIILLQSHSAENIESQTEARSISQFVSQLNKRVSVTCSPAADSVDVKILSDLDDLCSKETPPAKFEIFVEFSRSQVRLREIESSGADPEILNLSDVSFGAGRWNCRSGTGSQDYRAIHS